MAHNGNAGDVIKDVNGYITTAGITQLERVVGKVLQKSIQLSPMTTMACYALRLEMVGKVMRMLFQLMTSYQMNFQIMMVFPMTQSERCSKFSLRTLAESQSHSISK